MGGSPASSRTTLPRPTAVSPSPRLRVRSRSPVRTPPRAARLDRASNVEPIAQRGSASQRQELRARRRQDDPRLAQELLQARTILEQDSVTALTRERYADIIKDIDDWPIKAGQTPLLCLTKPLPHVSTLDAEIVDHKPTVWMQAMFLDGLRSDRGSLALSAVKFVWPQLGRRGTLTLPRAEQALRDWRRRAPLTSRLPLPWEVAALIATDMMKHGDVWMGFL